MKIGYRPVTELNDIKLLVRSNSKFKVTCRKKNPEFKIIINVKNAFYVLGFSSA
jgi:hypothetical protein